MGTEVEDLKAALGSCGAPVPASLRKRAGAYARTAQSDGTSVAQIARDLGVSRTTLVHWLQASTELDEGFRAVEIVPAEAATERRGRIQLFDEQSGVRVEVEHVGDAAELIRRLR